MALSPGLFCILGWLQDILATGQVDAGSWLCVFHHPTGWHRPFHIVRGSESRFLAAQAQNWCSHSHFTHLVKAGHETSPDSTGGEAPSISCWVFLPKCKVVHSREEQCIKKSAVMLGQMKASVAALSSTELPFSVFLLQSPSLTPIWSAAL